MASLGHQSDMSIYQPVAEVVHEPPQPETTEQTASLDIDPSIATKALIRLNELSGVEQRLVEKHLAGRNPDNMSVDELANSGVIDAVEDGLK